MIQSEKVDVLTGIIWSNLAMAVIPSATAQGKFYLSPNAGPAPLAGKGCHPNYFNVAWQNDNLQEIWAAIAQLKRESGVAILVVDKTIKELRRVADRAVILEKGRSVCHGPMSALNAEITDQYLGV